MVLTRAFRNRSIVCFVVLSSLVVGLIPAMAQTPVPPPTADEMITAGSSLLTDLGVLPIVFAGAIIGIAVFLFRRFKSGAR